MDVVFFQRLDFIKESKCRNFIQILNIRNNHCIEISNISCDDSNQVVVYDSLKNSLNKDSLLFINKIVNKLIDCISHLFVANVLLQDGLDDCKLFALMFATDSCFFLVYKWKYSSAGWVQESSFEVFLRWKNFSLFWERIMTLIGLMQ